MEQLKQKELTERVFSYIEQRDRLGLLRCLETNSTIPLVDIVDQRGYTALHMACFKNIAEIVECLLEKAKELITEQ
jgi:ankyrin repeat protein